MGVGGAMPRVRAACTPPGLARRRPVLAVLSLTCALLAGPAFAQQAIDDAVLIEADDMVYDRQTEIVTATGNVEIASDDRVLFADQVVYDRNTATVTANGNVSLLQPDGQVMFADSMVLSDDFSDGVAETVRLLLLENARVAAASGTRRAGNRTELNKAVYTACDVCESDPDAPPLWQIRSFEVVHDKEKKRVEYADAFLEFFGVPVFYTPYFSHPDPSVKRQTGFLPPTIAISEDFGTVLRTPFFWNLAPNYDLTFKPRWQTEVGHVFGAEFRHHVGFGEYRIDMSATWPKEDDVLGNKIEPFRAHVFADGRFDVTETTEAGFDIKLASDETYLRRYDILNENDLISNAYVRHVDGRNFAQAEAFYFQGLLSTDDQASIPVIAPLVEAEYYLEPQIAGGQVTVDFNAVNVIRDEGTSFQRFSGGAGWELARTARTGEQFRAFADVRGDVYLVDEDPLNGTGRDTESTETRVLPTVGLEYRWPWIAQTGDVSHVVEPIVQAIYSPSNGNPNAIPNDDSLAVDFDTTNLFDRDRFPGLDRFEDGARVNYGVQYSVLDSGGGQASALLGQSYRLEENNAFPAGSGLRDQQSDVVGRVQINPGPYLDLVSRFRVDPKDGTLLRNEVQLSSVFNVMENRPLFFGANYVFLDAALDPVNNTEGEEVSGSFYLNLVENWWLSGHARRDLRRAAMVSDGIALTYQDECFLFTLGFNQSFIRDRDIEPESSLMFRIQLVTLGEAAGTTTLYSPVDN